MLLTGTGPIIEERPTGKGRYTVESILRLAAPINGEGPLGVARRIRTDAYTLRKHAGLAR
jgi:hypothetical protein